MGANTSVQTQKLEEMVRNELSMSATATADCSAVQSNEAVFDGMEGCTYTAQNKCIAEASVDVATMSEAIRNIAQQVGSQNEASGVVLGQANTSVQETETLMTRISEIEQDCTAKTDAELQQDNKITVKNCKNSHVVLLNAGDARAACVLRNVQRDMLSFDQVSTSSNTLEGLDPTALMASSMMPAIACVVCVLGVGMMGSMGGGGSNGGGGGGAPTIIMGGAPPPPPAPMIMPMMPPLPRATAPALPMGKVLA